ncbi:GGDEF domain-containing protein [Neptunicella sp. SCSIO 80796]|uniref:GGDEF domain-containing protein n=1 Tax=Neptunicella plasticusilytica TaxID=3117012 RepID=UPI003A4E4609
MQKQTATLNKELENLKQSQAKMVRSFKHQIDLLGQFIIRVSRFYANANSELDEEFQVLRGHLGGRSNFALAENSINKITKLLVRDADLFKLQSNKITSLLHNSVKSLQTKQDISDSVKQEAVLLLSQLHETETTIFNSLPHFERALLLYQKALENTPGQRSSDANVNQNIEKTDRLHQSICDELEQLVSQLAASDKNDPELKQIRQMLIEGISHQELLKCCLLIIRSILKDVITERNYAERFISDMHKTLVELNQKIDLSIEETTACMDTKQATHQKLKEQLVDMTEVVSQATDLEHLKEQASSYLQKLSDSIQNNEQADKQEQLSLIKLLNAMQSQIAVLEEQAANYKHRLVEQKFHSHTDPLTQVPNRTAYMERIDLEFSRWQRYGHDLCIALADIDFFKSINDNYGHTAGDKTLRVIAQKIQSSLRTTDFLARWGGEEFVLIFPQTSASQLSKPLEVIRQHIERIPFKFKNQNVSISISIGATQLQAKDTVANAFERADKALYQAKAQGRNRCIIV